MQPSDEATKPRSDEGRAGSLGPAALGCLFCVILVTAAWVPAQTRPVASQPVGQVIVDGEIFGSQAAADAVRQGRLIDPLYTGDDPANRDQAAALYAQAIDLQPGARINAALAARIAELYAYGELRTKTVRPDMAKVRFWWQRTRDLTHPTQALWAKASLGLGSVALSASDYPAAIEAFKSVLDVDPEKLQLPDWQVAPGPAPRGAAPHSSQTLDELRKRVAVLRLLAAGEIGYAAALMSDQTQARKLLGELAARYRGSAVGACLADQLTRLPSDSHAGDIHDPPEP